MKPHMLMLSPEHTVTIRSERLPMSGEEATGRDPKLSRAATYYVCREVERIFNNGSPRSLEPADLEATVTYDVGADAPVVLRFLEARMPLLLVEPSIRQTDLLVTVPENIVRHGEREAYHHDAARLLVNNLAECIMPEHVELLDNRTAELLALKMGCQVGEIAECLTDYRSQP